MSEWIIGQNRKLLQSSCGIQGIKGPNKISILSLLNSVFHSRIVAKNIWSGQNCKSNYLCGLIRWSFLSWWTLTLIICDLNWLNCLRFHSWSSAQRVAGSEWKVRLTTSSVEQKSPKKEAETNKICGTAMQSHSPNTAPTTSQVWTSEV